MLMWFLRVSTVSSFLDCCLSKGLGDLAEGRYEMRLEYSGIGLNAKLFTGFLSTSCCFTSVRLRRKVFAAEKPLMNRRDLRFGFMFEFRPIFSVSI